MRDLQILNERSQAEDLEKEVVDAGEDLKKEAVDTGEDIEKT